MIRFHKQSNSPIIRPGAHDGKNAWHNSGILNPTVVEFDGKIFLYYRALEGINDNRHSIGVWTQPVTSFDPWGNWEENGNAPILTEADATVITWTGAERRLANPVALAHNGEVWLWAICKGAQGTGSGVDSWSPTVLFKSNDGISFTEAGLVTENGVTTSIHTGGMGIIHDGTKFVMVHSKGKGADGFRLVVRTSSDGLNWSTSYSGAFDNPDVIDDKDFDGYSYVTARLLMQGNIVHAVIGGGGDNRTHDDWPEGFALFRQHRDSVASAKWQEYKYNPVFLRGSSGSPDGGAIWSGAIIQIAEETHMFYEGAGNYDEAPDSSLAQGTRDFQYHSYFSGTHSSILHAKCPITNFNTAWNDTIIETGTLYLLRNMATGAYVVETGHGNGDPAVADVVPNQPWFAEWLVERDNEFFIFRTRSTSPNPVLETGQNGMSESDTINVWQQGTGHNEKQEWHLIALKSYKDRRGGLFYVQNRKSGLFLAQTNTALKITGQSQLQQQRFTGALNQQWVIHAAYDQPAQ